MGDEEWDASGASFFDAGSLGSKGPSSRKAKIELAKATGGYMGAQGAPQYRVSDAADVATSAKEARDKIAAAVRARAAAQKQQSSGGARRRSGFDEARRSGGRANNKKQAKIEAKFTRKDDRAELTRMADKKYRSEKKAEALEAKMGPNYAAGKKKKGVKGKPTKKYTKHRK